MTPTDKLADELRVGDPVKKTSGDYHPSGRLASIYPDPDTGSMRYVMKHDCCGAHHIYNASQLTAASRASGAGVRPSGNALDKFFPADSGVLQDDLRDMLQALGLPDGARPQSPHEVFRECIERVRKLRAATQEALDLLAERKHGNPARSPGHNARLCLEDVNGSSRASGVVTDEDDGRTAFDAAIDEIKLLNSTLASRDAELARCREALNDIKNCCDINADDDMLATKEAMQTTIIKFVRERAAALAPPSTEGKPHD